MKKIGFIDFYISEWHANNYPAWIKEKSAVVGEEFKVAYCWAEKDVSPVDNRTTAEWCQAFDVEECSSIKEICEKSDVIMILSPSNPEKHLEYCQEAFKHVQGKRVYVDKTFAPDYETAKKIFDIAEEYGVEFFSTSALRYSTQLQGIENLNTITVYGGGRLCEEMCVKTMGFGAEKVKMNLLEDGTKKFTISYKDGRVADLNYNINTGFKVVIDGNVIEVSDFFPNLLERILRFYNGEPCDFDTKQTLEVIGIREAVVASLDKEDTWIEVK